MFAITIMHKLLTIARVTSLLLLLLFIQVYGIVAVRITVNNICMIVMENVAGFIMCPMGIPVVRYVSYGYGS